MAEQVQAALDQMVEPLKDLMDRQIFTSAEVQAIVERRRESEYLLRRRAARKADFLRYIEIEQKLEELRVLRTEQKRRDHRKSKNSKKPTDRKKEEQHIGDVHIVQLIHLLFVRAIRKFRSDVSLHLLHVDFCKKQKSWTRLGRVYAEALQIFPRETGLWIESASHEFFGPRRSIRSARILMQRGLRINPKAEDLWVEYFSLELHYAQTLKGRRQILLGEESTTEEERGNSEDEYKIAKIVLKNAIQNIPDSIPFRFRFLDTCRRFPNTEELVNFVQGPLQRDFSSKPEAWMARALYELEKKQKGELSGLTAVEQAAADASENEKSDPPVDLTRPNKKAKSADTVVAVLQEALEELPSDDMYLQAFRFAQQYQDELEESNDEASAGEVKSLIAYILRDTGKRESAEFALEAAEYYVAFGSTDKAVDVLQSFCNVQGKTPSASVWIRWASLVPPTETTSILKRAVKRTPMNEPDHLQILLQYFGSLLQEKDSDKKEEQRQLVHDTFQQILLLAPTRMTTKFEDVAMYPFGIECVVQACHSYLNDTFESYGLKSARKVYDLALFQSTCFQDGDAVVHPDTVDHLQAFLDKCLDLENGADKSRLRRVLDKVLDIFEDTPLEEVYRDRRNEMALY